MRFARPGGSSNITEFNGRSVQICRFVDTDTNRCLQIFDSNCPQFFHPDERADYAAFLCDPGAYFVCRVDERVVGAFGLEPEAPGRARIRWILLERDRQGSGLGTHIMRAVCSIARDGGAALIDIAASHKSAPFFERFGAREIDRRENGWGSGMHRVDLELAL